MFDKMLSKIGIGAAKVDTVLHESSVMRGEVITGEIRMVGGKSAQKVNKVYIELQTQYVQEHDEGSSMHTVTLHRLDIADAFTLEANEEVIYDFELQVPLVTPISIHHTHSWIRTGLDVSWAFDPKDHDQIEILPDPAAEMVLSAAEALGFHHTHHSGRCIYMHNPFGVPFVQEFELRGSGALGRHIEELDLTIMSNDHEAQVQVEVDRRNHGVMGWLADEMDLDETRLRFRLPHDAQFGPRELEEILMKAVH